MNCQGSWFYKFISGWNCRSPVHDKNIEQQLKDVT